MVRIKAAMARATAGLTQPQIAAVVATSFVSIIAAWLLAIACRRYNERKLCNA